MRKTPRLTVLITGGTGLTGSALVQEAPEDINLVATYYKNDFYPRVQRCKFVQLNILSQVEVMSLWTAVKPDIIIHTVGIANVDDCQKNPRAAWASNVDGLRYVIERCKEHDSKLVYISTNAVFDGKKPPYSEDDKPCPVNTYGRIKAQCEQLVQKSGVEYSIVRPILMYGWPNKGGRLNPLTWVVGNLERGKRLNVVTDVYENPLFNKSCAEAIWNIVSQDKRGIYHIAGRDVVNRYTLALLIAEVFKLDPSLITPVTSDFFPEIAPRPKNTSFVTHKMEQELGMIPMGLSEGLICARKHRTQPLYGVCT